MSQRADALRAPTAIGIVGLGRVGHGIQALLTERTMADEAPPITVVGIDRDDNINAIARCDLVIEAVTEDLRTKAAVLTSIHEKVPSADVLSTTSSLTARSLRDAVGASLRIGIWHPFTPIAKRRLVEIAVGDAVDTRTVEAAHFLARQIGHTSIEVADTTGFVANRILKRWTHAGLTAAEAGVSAFTLDAAWRARGFRMGPVRVVGLVGPATSLEVSRRFVATYGARFSPPELLIAAAEDPALLERLMTTSSHEEMSPARLDQHLADAEAAVREECRAVLDEHACRSGAEGVRTALTVGLGWPPAWVEQLVG